MEDTVREMENVGVQLEAVSDLLSVILDNLLYFGKLNPASGDATDQLEVATLCSNLPKGQSLLYLAQEKVRDIQGYACAPLFPKPAGKSRGRFLGQSP